MRLQGCGFRAILMEGVELAARFALPPNSMGYCGKMDFARLFKAFLGSKSLAAKRKLEKSLEKFTAHYAYLRLIAAASKRKPFDREVAEALWIGNRLLEKAGKKDLGRFILRQFCGKGMLPKKRANMLAKCLPEGMVPHHSFHALYLHTVSGVIEPRMENADRCRISWGKVVGAKGEKLAVETQRLAKKDGRLLLAPCRRIWRTSCAGIRLLDGAEAGEWVAAHWGVAVVKLTLRQKNALAAYTWRNIEALNCH